MLRTFGKWAVVLVAGVGAASITLGALVDDKDKVPTVAEIMEEGHSGKKSLFRKISDAVDDNKVASVEKEAKRLKELGEAIGKNKQPKGSDAGWKKLTEQYKKDTAALFEAIGKKDQKKAEELVAKIKKSCQVCHDDHKDE